jgi:GNAT superfamily N-acetyltransferase
VAILIREALVRDAEELFLLTADFATSFQPARDTFHASFSRLLDHDDALLLVAEESGVLCGYLHAFDHDTLFANGRVAWVEELMVRKDRRREGIGRQLMEHFEKWAISRGAVVAALATRRAAEFYLAIGYEESAAYFRKVFTSQ